MPDDPETFEPVQEGSRWRFARPTGDEVATWFGKQPLDDGMDAADFVSGIVLIPASENVKRQVPGRQAGTVATVESREMTFTPYVRVDTRVRYFRKLGDHRELVSVIEPAEVPQITSGAFSNAHLPDGYWWYVIGSGDAAKRSLCCTMRVALYRPEDYFGEGEDTNAGPARRARPVLFGASTKQVDPFDQNALAKAETGAIGRALGVAGILVIGTGIATAEDMAEMEAAPIQTGPALPAGGAPTETSEQVSERCVALQQRLQQERPEKWTEFAAWWQERRSKEGWGTLTDAPLEVRRGMATRMQGLLDAPTEQGGEG
jgi:hypothetical protein